MSLGELVPYPLPREPTRKSVEKRLCVALPPHVFSTRRAAEARVAISEARDETSGLIIARNARGATGNRFVATICGGRQAEEVGGRGRKGDRRRAGRGGARVWEKGWGGEKRIGLENMLLAEPTRNTHASLLPSLSSLSLSSPSPSHPFTISRPFFSLSLSLTRF